MSRTQAEPAQLETLLKVSLIDFSAGQMITDFWAADARFLTALIVLGAGLPVIT